MIEQQSGIRKDNDKTLVLFWQLNAFFCCNVNSKPSTLLRKKALKHIKVEMHYKTDFFQCRIHHGLQHNT